MDDDDATNPDFRWLYHYTSASALQGLVTSKTLWATDARFLNDAQELQYGREALRDALRREVHPLLLDPDYPFTPSMQTAASIYEQLDRLLESDDEAYVQSGAHTAYVTCFSAQRRQLSQWRSYGRDGYCLRFEREMLTRELPDGSHFAQIVYGQNGIEPMVRSALSKLREIATKIPTDSAASKYLLSAEATLYPETLAALCSVKHGAFIEEGEWRLIRVGRPSDLGGEQFRLGPIGLTPYLKIPFPAECLTVVDVAPGPHQHLRAAAARKFLDSNAMGHVRVRRDEAPLR